MPNGPAVMKYLLKEGHGALFDRLRQNPLMKT
jgi:hypothetical protein